MQSPCLSLLLLDRWNQQETTKAGGMGWIIKNTAGEVIIRGSSNHPLVCPALTSEALAMRDALNQLRTWTSCVYKSTRTLKS